MADIRINALATTATASASDDYIAIDGSANGTRKILASNIAQNVSDVVLGTSGPSVKSSLDARAARQGLVFDGTSYATLATAIPAFGTGDFSVFAWVNSDLTVSVQGLLGSVNSPTGGFGLWTSSDGTLSVQFIGNTTIVGPSGVVTAGKATLVGYTRTTVGGVSTGTFYSNGIAKGTVTDANNYSVGVSLIGAFGGSNIFKGSIVPLIYNRALSASEVVSLFESGVPSGADYASGGAANSVYTTDFSSSTGWTLGPGSTISGGKLNIAPSGYSSAPVATALVKGTQYRFKVTVDSVTSGANVCYYDGVAYQVIATTAGTYTVTFTSPTNYGSLILNSFGGSGAVVDNFTFDRVGLLIAPDAGQPGNGLVWTDLSGNGAQIVLPTSGVTWNVPGAAGTRVRGTTSTNGNQLLLGGTSILANSQITRVRLRSRTGTPLVSIGTSAGGAQIVAAALLSTTWQNMTLVLTGGIVSANSSVWVSSNSTDVVEVDIDVEPLSF